MSPAARAAVAFPLYLATTVGGYLLGSQLPGAVKAWLRCGLSSESLLRQKSLFVCAVKAWLRCGFSS